MLSNQTILLGYSGHGYVVTEAALKAGISVDYYADRQEASENPFELEYIGFEADEDFMGWGTGSRFMLGIGDNNLREKIANAVLKKNERLLSVIHPSAVLAQSVKVGNGTFISAQATINALANLGDYAILNTGCIIEHECYIGNGSHIAPGAVLAGGVKIGKRSFIGGNAVIKEGISIGNDVIVGAGSTIIKDITDGQKVAGNPGREI